MNKKSHVYMNFPPLTIIAHNIDFFNEMVRENYYFYVDILKTGIVLYNKDDYELSKPSELTLEKVKS